jgi:hypothetical protein
MKLLMLQFATPSNSTAGSHSTVTEGQLIEKDLVGHSHGLIEATSGIFLDRLKKVTKPIRIPNGPAKN